ncbi:MAG: Hpt domain-containing protein [Phycisphaerae bacterium]|nr:Hpt domain-containing protein [Phycisphaerae bacterium]
MLPNQPQRLDPNNHPETASPPIDLDALFEQCMDDASIVGLVLDKLALQLASDLVRVDDSFRNFETDSIRRTAHALKGAAGAAGAALLESSAHAVELRAREGTLDAASDELNRLKQELLRCIDYVQTARDLAAMRGKKSR